MAARVSRSGSPGPAPTSVILPLPEGEKTGGREGGPKLLLSLRKACRMVEVVRGYRRREEEGEEVEGEEEEGLRKAVVLVVLLPSRRRRRREAMLAVVVVAMVLCG